MNYYYYSYFALVPFVLFLFLSAGCLHSAPIESSAEPVINAKMIGKFIKGVQYNVKKGVKLLEKSNAQGLNVIEEQMQTLKKSSSTASVGNEQQLNNLFALLDDVLSMVRDKAIELAKKAEPFNDNKKFAHAYKYEQLLIGNKLQEEQQKMAANQKCLIGNVPSNNELLVAHVIKGQVEMVSALALADTKRQQQWEWYFANFELTNTETKTPDELMNMEVIQKNKTNQEFRDEAIDHAKDTLVKLTFLTIPWSVTIVGPFVISLVLMPYQCLKIGYHKISQGIDAHKVKHLEKEQAELQKVVRAESGDDGNGIH